MTSPSSMKMHSSLVRRACPMLWVTIAIVYVSLQVVHQPFDRGGAFRVQRRTGFVHQDDLRLEWKQTCDAQLLLLLQGELPSPSCASRP